MISTKTWEDFLRPKGYTGSLNEALADFLADQGFTGQLNEALYAYLDFIDFTGTLPDKIKAWESGGLIVPTAPPKPTMVTFTNITSTSADVNWAQPLDDGGSPITQITLQWGPVGGPYTDVIDPIHPYPLTGLTASTNYEARIRATNKIGVGEFSDFNQFTTLV